MSSACVLIFNTHSFCFLHHSESHCRYFESTLRYAEFVLEVCDYSIAMALDLSGGFSPLGGSPVTSESDWIVLSVN